MSLLDLYALTAYGITPQAWATFPIPCVIYRIPRRTLGRALLAQYALERLS